MSEPVGTTGQSSRPLRIGSSGRHDHQRVLRFLPGLAKLSDRAVATAIASGTRPRAKAVAAAYGIGSVYDDLACMLTQGRLDAVVKATPATEHFERRGRSWRPAST
jgi:predicted dehydrogenase